MKYRANLTWVVVLVVVVQALLMPAPVSAEAADPDRAALEPSVMDLADLAVTDAEMPSDVQADLVCPLPTDEGQPDLYVPLPPLAGAVAVLAAAFPGESVPVRINRILEGAESLDALSGKVATGGRLNLYNALRIYGNPNMAPIYNLLLLQ